MYQFTALKRRNIRTSKHQVQIALSVNLVTGVDTKILYILYYILFDGPNLVKMQPNSNPNLAHLLSKEYYFLLK